MPLYDFKCEACNARVELLRPMQNALQPVTCVCGVPMVQELSAPFITPDIAPYQALTGDKCGQQIGSRKAHREFLKRNRLVEAGDAPIKDTQKMRSHIKKGEVAQELKRVIPQVLRKHGRRH